MAAYHVVWKCVVEQWLDVRRVLSNKGLLFNSYLQTRCCGSISCCVGMCCGAVARCASYDAHLVHVHLTCKYSVCNLI